jgi:hypothetical protein
MRSFDMPDGFAARIEQMFGRNPARSLVIDADKICRQPGNSRSIST